jgi:hypothetical protein
MVDQILWYCFRKHTMPIPEKTRYHANLKLSTSQQWTSKLTIIDMHMHTSSTCNLQDIRHKCLENLLWQI